MKNIIIVFFIIWFDFLNAQYDDNSTAPVSYLSLTILPGIDTLGWGVDLRLSSDIPTALKVPLFDFVYQVQNQTYVYPLYPHFVFRHPDNTLVRTAALVETEAIVYQNLTQEIQQLKLDLGISGTFQDNSQTDGIFSGDLTLNYDSVALDTGNYTKITNRLRINYWQLYLGYSSTIKPVVQYAMNQLLLLDPTDQIDLLQFLDRYGTHYIDSLMVGGTLEMDITSLNTISNTTEQLNALANAAFQNLFGISHANLTLDLDYSQQVTEFVSNVTNNLYTLGGNYSVNNFFSGNNDPASTYEQWIGELITNPVPIRFRCVPIYTLFSDQDLIQRLQTATQAYLQGAVPLNTAFISVIP